MLPKAIEYVLLGLAALHFVLIAVVLFRRGMGRREKVVTIVDLLYAPLGSFIGLFFKRQKKK